MNKFGLIAAALGGIATAGLAKFYAAARAYETERAAGKFDDDVTEAGEGHADKKPFEIVWISADEADDHREPLFGMNERVTIVNPYEMAAWVDIETEVPHEYRITDMEFDMQDAVWRYKLEADGIEDDRWYSEEWLEEPLFTQMTKGANDMQTKKAGGINTESNRKLQIDYYLAHLHEAMAAKDEKKAAECHAELKRLSAEGTPK
jgi:hypothetical protein